MWAKGHSPVWCLLWPGVICIGAVTLKMLTRTDDFEAFSSFFTICSFGTYVDSHDLPNDSFETLQIMRAKLDVFKAFPVILA